MRSLRIALPLLAICVVSETMGSIGPTLGALFAFLLMAGFAVWSWNWEQTLSFSKNLAWGLGLIAVSPALAYWGVVGKLVAILTFIFGLDLMLRSVGRTQRELTPLIFSGSLYTFYFILYQHLPWMRFLAYKLAISVSSLSGRALGQDLALGPTPFALHTLVLFALFFVGLFLFSEHKNIKVMILVMVLLLIEGPIFIGLRQAILYLFSQLPRAPQSVPVNLQIVSFGLLVAIASLPLSTFRWREVAWSNEKRQWPTIAAGLASLFLFLTCLGMSLEDSKDTSKIVFLDRGLLNWRLPVHGQYGLKMSGAMFGYLPLYLESVGYRTTKIDTVDSETLYGAGTLVVINLEAKLANSEKAAVWDFVRGGGSLLVLGDHTGLGGIRVPLNHLLDPTQIRLNFDSAVPFTRTWGWKGSYEFMPHPITWGLKSAEDVGISIGGSLTVSARADPLIVGRYAFSDYGNPNDEKRAFMGDMVYGPGEQLGDVVLVGGTRVGKGKVLVFGDTSPFQNGALVRTATFVQRVFNWLMSTTRLRYRLMLIIASFLLFAGSLVYWLYRKIQLTIALMGLVCATILSAHLTAHMLLTHSIADRVPQGNVAYIDDSHMERVDPAYYADTGTAGLAHNLMRNGFLPLLLKRFDRASIRSSTLLVIIAPAKPFRKSETDAMQAFVRDGGTLIICTGWEESAGSVGLLRTFGVRISNVPLGSVAPAQSPEGTSFCEAWPVRGERAGAECLCKVWDYPVIIAESYGRGRVIVIGDSSFLLNRNLEGSDYFYQENILFLKDMLR